MHRCPECLNQPGDVERCPLCEGVGEFESIAGDVWQQWFSKRIKRDPEIERYVGKCTVCGEEYRKHELPPMPDSFLMSLHRGDTSQADAISCMVQWHHDVEALKRRHPDRNYGLDCPPHDAPCGIPCAGGLPPGPPNDDQWRSHHWQGACTICKPVFWNDQKKEIL